MSTNDIPTGDERLLDVFERLEKLEKSVGKCCKSKSAPMVKVYPDDESVCPTPDGSHGFDLKFGSKSPEAAIPPRMAFPLDCGFDVELPKGMRMVVQTTEEWAMKGLVLTVNTYDDKVDKRRASVIAYNIGKQILAFEHGQVLGKVWFVPAEQVVLVINK